MINSAIFKFLKKESKLILSFVLILIMLIIGLNWPDKNPKADIISDLGLRFITTDLDRPYTLLTAEIEGSLGSSEYYLYQTNAPLYFFSDLKSLGVRASEVEINNNVITVKKYKYNSALKNWEEVSIETIESSNKISNVGDGLDKYGSFNDNENFYRFGSIGGSYGVVDALDNFGFSAYVPSVYGEYIIGYCGPTTEKSFTLEDGSIAVEGKTILNKNFINYEKFDSNLNIYPIHNIFGNETQDDNSLSLTNFYRVVNLFNDNDESGAYYYSNGNNIISVDGTTVQFSYDLFNSDEYHDEESILDTPIEIPERYTDYYNNSEVFLDWFAKDLEVLAVSNNSGLLTESNYSTNITEVNDGNGSKVIVTINDYHQVIFYTFDNDRKEIQSIEIKRLDGASDYLSYAIKIPLIQYNNFNGQQISVGREFALIFKEEDGIPASHTEVSNYIKSLNEDSTFENKLMIYNNFMDYEVRNTYNAGNNEILSDGFLNDSNYSKDIYLRAFSALTDIQCEDHDGYNTLIDINNGVTTYTFYGQLMGYVPEAKTSKVDFSLELLGSDNTDLYTTNDGLSIYYSPSAGSSEKMNLVTIENQNGYSKVKLFADNISKYRLYQENIDAFSSFGLKASTVNNGKTITKNSTVRLINDNESLIEMYRNDTIDSSFKENWLPIEVEELVTSLPIENRYPQLPISKTEMAQPCSTLINYGEYQLLLYTSSQPKYIAGSLNFQQEIDIEVWRYYNKNWIFENHAKKLSNVSVELPMKAGLAAIDFINYDLLDSYNNSVVLEKNELFDDGSPKLRLVKIPQLNSSDARHYIFVDNSIGFYAFTSSDGITADGNEYVVYPSSGQWWVLVQNTWIKINESTALANGFKTEDRYAFEKALRYTNDDNSAWTNVEPWVADNWASTVNYFRYIPIFAATSGYNYIIYETTDGFEALEYSSNITGEITITEDGIKFENELTLQNGSYSGIILKKYANQFWNTENKDILNGYISNSNGSSYFNRPGAINSIIYSNRDILDGSGNVVVSNMFSQSLIVSKSLAVADLSCSSPMNKSNEISINGVSYPYVIITQENIQGQTTYVAYISNNEFKYTTAATTGFDIVSNNYPLTVYKQVWDVDKSKWNAPELIYDISEDAGTVNAFGKSYTEISNGVVTAIYNQYPNGRVEKFDSSMSDASKQEGHFILELREDNSTSVLPENAYEVYFDADGNEYRGRWDWKWSDTQTTLLDYYYNPNGVKVTDTTRTHRYYKIVTFEASGNLTEFVSKGEYINFYGNKVSMGHKDLLGNWFSDDGTVVTPSANYGYYDVMLNLVDTRNKGQYYYTREDVNGDIVSGLWNFEEENGPGEATNRLVDICKLDNIKWINRDILGLEDVYVSSEEYSSITFIDSNIEVILGNFINPTNVNSQLNYISPQVTNGQENYWITFFDYCSNIWNPFSKQGVGEVAKDINNLIFYVPNFGNIQKIFSGKVAKGGVAFDVSSFSPQSEIIKSEGEWYVEEIFTDDTLSPLIDAIYMQNHTLKISANDPGAFATVFDEEGNVKYKEHTFEDVQINYRYITPKEYKKSLNKENSDMDGVPYFKTIGGKNYKVFDNNNVILLSYSLDENGNTIEEINGDYTFSYVLTTSSSNDIDLNEKKTIEGYNSSTENIDFYLSIPVNIEIDGKYYCLENKYQILDNILYRVVDSKADFEKRISVYTNQVVSDFNIYHDDPNSTMTLDTEHGFISYNDGKYTYSHDGNTFDLSLNNSIFYERPDGEVWEIVLTSFRLSEIEDYYNLGIVRVNNKVKTYTYLTTEEIITDSFDITRLLKKLSDKDIERIANSSNSTWGALTALNDNKGLKQYYNSSESPWAGANVETISATTIGDDGYLYRDGEKVGADTSYDEDGNEIIFSVSGVDKYFITIEEDFYSDIAFSYVDMYGETINIAKGQRVTSIDKFGNKTTIPLVDNTFMFPVDQETGEFKFNAYVLDKVGNKSKTITGPWTITRKDLGSTKDWKEFFIAGTATDRIKSEINTAIEANTSDTYPPKITGVFLYKGNLYIVAIDEDDKETGAVASGIGLTGTYNYIFNHTNFNEIDLLTHKEIDYFSDSSMTQIIPAGTPLENVVGIDLGKTDAYFETIKDFDGKIVEAELDLSVFDIARNQSSILHVEISDEKNNTVVYGNVSQSIYEMLLAERDKEGKDDNIAPIIKAIYVLDNILYVEAEDNVGIATYGYKWALESLMPVDSKGLDDEGNEIIIKAGETIPKGTILWHGAAQQGVTVPTKMIIYVEDLEGNASYETVVISSSNQLLYGTVDKEIMDKITEDTDEPIKNVAPTIENVYTYKGYLYVEGFDLDDNLTTWCYGFKPLDNMLLKSAYQGYNNAFTFIDIPAGTTIKANQQIYKKINSQEINIPMNITVSMRDALGLETSETFYIFKDNYIYKGSAPDNIKGEIEKPGGENPSITPTPNPGGSGDEGEGEGTPIPTPTPLPNPEKPLPIPPEFEDVDWKLYDYLFEVLDENTERVVYSIIEDEAATISFPRLENSVLYKYRISAISEETKEIDLRVDGQVRMGDTIPPTITKIWYSKNRIYVSAYDLGGFDDTPFSFTIEGSRNTPEKFISNNNTVVLSDEIVIVKVRDASGNIAKARVKVGKTGEVLYESLNPKEYFYINSSDTKSLAYWYAYINTTYGIDVTDSYLSDTNKSDNVNYFIENNNVHLTLKGDGVITFYDKKTNKYLGLNLRTLDKGKSFRSILTQTNSEVDVALAFKNKLLEQFGTIDGLSWYTDGEILTRIGSRVVCNKPGVGTIKFVYNGKELTIYILVVDSISSTKTNCDFEEENFAYTYLLKDKVFLKNALRLSNENEAEYIVMEDSSKGVSRTGNVLTFSKSGRKNISLINCVDDELGSINFEVILITPYISKFTDIIGSDARADIELLCEKGFIGNYPDEKYKPKNKMTTKEFLTMVNKIKLTYDTDFQIDKIFTSLNLSERDFDYYSSQNVLINMNQLEVDEIIGTYTLNKAITFEEVVKLISATLLYDKYHNEEGIKAPETLSSCTQEAIHLISMGIIDKDENRNATRELTRAEIAYLLTKTIKFLEL